MRKRIVVKEKQNTPLPEPRVQFKHYKNLNNSFSSLMNNKTLSDVQITVFYKNQSTQFYVHKLVLITRSQYFKEILKNTNVVTIYEVKPSAVFEVLSYLYSTEITLKLDDILDVMKVSKIWNLLDVHNLATEYIFNHSDYDVFIKSLYYLLNQDLLLNGFEVQVRKLLEKHNRIYHFIFDDTFLECSSSIVTEVLKSNEIEISEIYLLERLIVWAKHKNGKFEEIIQEPLQSIRCGILTVDDLFKIKNYSFISQEFYLKGLEYNITPDGPHNKNDLQFQKRRQVEKLFPPTKKTIYQFIGGFLTIYLTYALYKNISFKGIFNRIGRMFYYIPIINRFLPQ